jgi:hypothetical protein
MPATSQHSSIINRVARETLGPHGFVQKGRSRFWYNDQEWRAFFVEFQPSGWSKGTYCNVGVMWLWQPREVVGEPHWTGDMFERVGIGGSDFASYDDDPAGFEKSVAGLAASAVKEFLRLRDQFSSVAAVAHFRGELGPGWPTYHRSVAQGLIGSRKEASAGFSSVARVVAASLWPNDTHKSWIRNAERLSMLAHDSGAFKAAIESQIAGCREGLKLIPLPSPLIRI